MTVKDAQFSQKSIQIKLRLCQMLFNRDRNEPTSAVWGARGTMSMSVHLWVCATFSVKKQVHVHCILGEIHDQK